MKNPGFKGLYDGQVFWVARFADPATDSLLFYYPKDGHWWLAIFKTGLGQFDWTRVSSTNASKKNAPHNFGPMIREAGYRFLTGKFSQNQRDEVLVYIPGDNSWWLATLDASKAELAWSHVGNSPKPFGTFDTHHKLWTGKFSQNQRDEVLLYYSGSKHWWLATFDTTKAELVWSQDPVADTSTTFVTPLDVHKTWIGQFSQDQRDEVLVYDRGNGFWWLATGQVTKTYNPATGTYEPTSVDLPWAHVGNTPKSFGSLGSGHKLWTGKFSSNLHNEILLHYPDSGHWWLATLNVIQTFSSRTVELVWSPDPIADTSTDPYNFSPLTGADYKFWVGEFTNNSPRDEMLFYHAGGHWWLGNYYRARKATEKDELVWQRAREQTHFGNLLDDHHKIWRGRFSQAAFDDMLFYYLGDGHWWLGSFTLVPPLNGIIRWDTASIQALRSTNLFTIELDQIDLGSGTVKFPQITDILSTENGVGTPTPDATGKYTQVDFAVTPLPKMPTQVDLQLTISVMNGAFSTTTGKTEFEVRQVAGPVPITFAHLYDNVCGLIYEVTPKPEYVVA